MHRRQLPLRAGQGGATRPEASPRETQGARVAKRSARPGAHGLRCRRRGMAQYSRLKPKMPRALKSSPLLNVSRLSPRTRKWAEA